MNNHYYGFKGKPSMKIRLIDGYEEMGFPDIMSSIFFNFARPGDKIKLKDKNYTFNIATYTPTVEERWIYTYAYAPDQNWSIYRNDLKAGSYTQDDYVFDCSVYFRVCLRKKNGEVFDGSEDMNEILSFETLSQEAPVEKAWIKNEVSRIIERVNSIKKTDGKTFLIMTDTHVTVNGTWGDTSSAIKLLNEGINFDGIIHLGDFTDGMVTKEATKQYVNDIINDVKSCGSDFWACLGNHDSNYFRNNPGRFSKKEQSELYLNGGELRYYKDLPSLRLIFLDSFDTELIPSYGYSKECAEFLSKSLKSMDNTRKAIIFSHLPPITKLQYWSAQMRGDNEITDILKAHSKNIPAWINGHNHGDKLDIVCGVPIVSLANAKCEAFTEYKTEGFITPERKLGEASQEAFDIMIVNDEGKTLNFVRFGAGNNKIITEGKAAWL